MSVVIQTATGARVVQAAGYGDELELQAAVAKSPSLLQDEADAPLALVQREVPLLDAGYLDLLAVDSDGLPVAVEVKLSRNAQSRREVVAQIVDYVASLTRLTVDELDRAVNGALESALRSFDVPESEDDGAFEKRWQAVGVNLRSGLARIVLVLDDAREDLVRIVKFLAEHSDFDLRLVTVSKYVTSDLGTLFVPAMLLSGGSRRTSAPPPVEPSENYTKLLEVAGTYAALPMASRVPVFGNARVYRLVRPPDWPWQWRLHYEFMLRSDEIGAELHLESDLAAQRLQSLLVSLAGTGIGPGKRPLVWDPVYFSGRGRLRVPFKIAQCDPSEVAQTMSDLIELTLQKVTAAMAPTTSAPAAGLTA